MAILQRNALHFTGDEAVLVYPACDVSSFAPCLHEEADTIMVAPRKQLKGFQENKQPHY